ncbi:metallophosphoesterase [candidate division KSB1 bacterium]|nr:metallophosphoesterase [candidate division KSB1 bacterium]
MKIGIMSDSHDNVPKIMAAIACFNERQVDWVIHAGDMVSPFAAQKLLAAKGELVVIFGNNEGERLGLARALGDKLHLAPHQLKAGDKTILICHEPYTLKALIQSQVYDGIIYGHTHTIDIRTEGKVVVINPGECGGWVTNRSTVVIWELTTNQIDLIEL